MRSILSYRLTRNGTPQARLAPRVRKGSVALGLLVALHVATHELPMLAIGAVWLWNFLRS